MSSSPHLLVCFAILAPALSAQSTLDEHFGQSPGDGTGLSVAIVGDVDADGFDDWAYGAPGVDDNGSSSGEVRLVSGLSEQELWAVTGSGPGAALGYALAAAGDVDGDGVPDLITGSPFDNPNGVLSGSAQVLSGADGTTLFSFDGDAAGHYFGSAVGALGDVTGDGRPELIVGAPGAELVRIFSGANGSLVLERTSPRVGGGFGIAVAGVPDATGDGVPDFTVGANLESHLVFESGAVYLFSGDPAAPVAPAGFSSGEFPSGHFGRSVAPAGDLDGDGLEDLLAGAPKVAGGMGRVRALLSPSLTEHLRINGDSNRARLGFTVCAPGDVTGDGIPNFVVGARSDWQNGVAAGAFLVYSSVGGVELAEVLGLQGDYLGYSTAGGGDVNGDGLNDFMVGAWRAKNNQGAARVYTMDACTTPVPYCDSSLTVAHVETVGSTSVSADNFQLRATGAPPGAPGIFFFGPTTAQVTFGSDLLCVGGGTLGLEELWPVATVAPDGSLTRPLALGAGNPRFVSGSTWSFQLYYSDPALGNAERVSTAIRVRFCP